MTSGPGPVLRLEGLTISAAEGSEWTTIVDGVSLSIDRGEIVGLVGESGCGKSSTAYAVLGYARSGTHIDAGTILLEGRDLLSLPAQQLRRLRGSSIALVPQNPGTSLTPSMRVGRQMGETLRAHECLDEAGASRRVLELLGEVGLPDPEAMARRYPHQLSGGQQQRVVIALALTCRPKLLILDEPTTALDVTSQAGVLTLLSRLRRTHGLSMLYVTHDIAVLGEISDRVSVMYAGQVVESSPTAEILVNPRHPYTRGLLASMPHWEIAAAPAQRLRGRLRRAELPPGCKFAPRCPHAETGTCDVHRQEPISVAAQHEVACWKWDRIGAGPGPPRSVSAAAG